MPCIQARKTNIGLATRLRSEPAKLNKSPDSTLGISAWFKAGFESSTIYRPAYELMNKLIDTAEYDMQLHMVDNSYEMPHDKNLFRCTFVYFHYVFH